MAKTKEAGLMTKPLIRVQGVRRKERKWQDTTDDCTREDTTGDCTSSNMYTKLLLLKDEHLYETLMGNNHPEFNIYDSIKVQDSQRLYCRYRCDQNSVTDSILNCYKCSESDEEFSTGPYLGGNAGYSDTVEKCLHAGDYENIASVVAPTSHSLIGSTWKCVADKQTTDVYESNSGDNNSTISPQLPKTMSFNSPRPLLKTDVSKSFNNVVSSSVQCQLCVPFRPKGGGESCTSSRQNIIVYDDDSDYAEIDFEAGDVECNREGVTSADQYMPGGDSLHQGRLIYRDAFCRKAFKRKGKKVYIRVDGFTVILSVAKRLNENENLNQ